MLVFVPLNVNLIEVSFMVLQLCCVYDRVAAAFGRPVFVTAAGSAVRSFQDELHRDAPDNEMFRHKGDFDLFHIGSFDDAVGLVTSFEKPLLLVTGASLKLLNGGRT